MAGLQGLKVGSGVLRPADAIGTTLLSLHRSASTERITAEDIATNFYYAMKGLGELGTWPHDEPSQQGDLSVVSINPDGTYDWISLSVPLTATEKRTARPLSAGTPTYSIRTTRRPLHFDVDVIGQRAIAYRLLQANSADWDSHSRSDIMTQCYQLKSADQLDHFTLIQAVILARELIQATIDLAAESAGVGGPIDIATLTKTGFRLHSAEVQIR